MFLLIGKTSALTMNIAGVIKDWMLIFFSYAVFHAPVTRLNLFGYAFCCTGVGIYNWQKLQVGRLGRTPHAFAACQPRCCWGVHSSCRSHPASGPERRLSAIAGHSSAGTGLGTWAAPVRPALTLYCSSCGANGRKSMLGPHLHSLALFGHFPAAAEKEGAAEAARGGGRQGRVRRCRGAAAAA